MTTIFLKAHGFEGFEGENTGASTGIVRQSEKSVPVCNEPGIRRAITSFGVVPQLEEVARRRGLRQPTNDTGT